MGRPGPEKQREPTAPAGPLVLPMELRVGDRLADETGEWEVIGRPCMTAAVQAGALLFVESKRIASLAINEEPSTWRGRGRTDTPKSWRGSSNPRRRRFGIGYGSRTAILGDAGLLSRADLLSERLLDEI